MKLSFSRHLRIVPLLLLAGRSEAVIFRDTGDAQHNTTSPGDNSGWQYEGKFLTFLGVPIAPHFFITASHIGGTPGTSFNFHGEIYTTIAVHSVGSTDLAIWEVDHAKPFLTYAPLSSGLMDVGATAMVIGRGTQRGAEVVVGGESKGWGWGLNDDVQRWGKNVVEGEKSNGALLYCDFNKSGITDECQLSVGDSGGGMFVLENGLWRLAGINYAIDGPFRTGPAGASIYAALYDAGGLEYSNPPNWIAIPEASEDVPASFYCSRISFSLAAITAIAPQVNSLAPENYLAWKTLYFSPAEIADPSSGPLQDFDGDGVSNLLEFALNLDPVINGQVTMAAGSGLRGLPLVGIETISGSDHLTIEFVRRTAASAGGIITVAKFTSDLSTWSSPGTETVVSINPRWERVKVVDSQATTISDRRFARVEVTLAD